jgi:hypothetical protein
VNTSLFPQKSCPMLRHKNPQSRLVLAMRTASHFSA